MAEVLNQYDNPELEQFRANYRHVISQAIEKRQLDREAIWTESIAVGNESFVRDIEENTSNRVELVVEHSAADRWTVREAGVAYN